MFDKVTYPYFLTIKVFFMYKKTLILSLLCISTSNVAALTMPAMFSDNMMLQQQSQAAIWGVDKPNSRVDITTSWGEKVSTLTNNKGEWRVKLPTPMATLNQKITVNGSEKKTINHVAIGEVWLCSGQSNMEMKVKGSVSQPVIGSNETILAAPNKNIRLFSVANHISLTEVSDVKGYWQEASYESVANYSASCYFFGKKLERVLNVPVGLITSAYGASSAEAWTPKEYLEKLDFVALDEKIRDYRPQTTTTSLYNGMLSPLVGYGIKGFVWYQGENNRPRAKHYTQLLSTMIGAWRDVFQQGDLPFYLVQIAPNGQNKKNIEGALLREAQLKTGQQVKNSGVVVTLDVGSCQQIHPPHKQQVGDRLAYWALANDYNIPSISYRAPEYKSMAIQGNKIALSFDYAKEGLSGFGEAIKGFMVAGEDQHFYPAKVKIVKNKPLLVWSDQVKKPVAVRYGFVNCPDANLFNVYGLPVSSFRTDNWDK